MNYIYYSLKYAQQNRFYQTIKNEKYFIHYMEISIKNESQRFLEFLLEKNNNNIIFSGIYGIGKSFFINDFFNNQHRDKYIPIFLTPVNYSVANNEDIFEYIKADILLQLLEKVPCDLNNCQISTSVATFYYIKNNLGTIIGNILSTAEKVCFQTDIIDKLLNLRENISKFQKENSISENTEIETFITGLSQKQGSIYESNIITQIIQTLISNSKEENKKEAILVIDDLDRIDPEHIFRILNIFSAHNDFCGSNEHKFKFDKNILVCDIENIRKIFHTKYGADVDFSGYIDKFYSKEIFYFQNEKEIARSIANQVLNIRGNRISNNQEYTYSCFVFILESLITFKQINIRTLQKLSYNYTFNGYVKYNLRDKIYIPNSPAITIFEQLKHIIGSEDKLLSSLQYLSTRHHHRIEENRPNGFFEIFIILSDFKKNKLDPSINELSYRNIKYSIESCSYTLATINYSTLDYLKANYFQTLYDAYLNYTQYFTIY